jgi:hypothetical protein
LLSIDKMEDYRRAIDAVSAKGCYQVELRSITKRIPKASQEISGDKALKTTVEAYIDGSPETLSQIEKVIYYPQPPHLFPSPVTVTDITDRFAIRWRVWGTFDLNIKSVI